MFLRHRKGLKDDTVTKEMQSLKYDKVSGNLYTESTFKNPRSLGVWFTKYPQERATRGYHLTEAPTLLQCCKNFISRNANDLTVEALASLDCRFGKMLWED